MNTKSINTKLANLYLAKNDIEKFYSLYGKEGQILLNIYRKYKRQSFFPKTQIKSVAYTLSLDQMDTIKQYLEVYGFKFETETIYTNPNYAYSSTQECKSDIFRVLFTKKDSNKSYKIYIYRIDQG